MTPSRPAKKVTLETIAELISSSMSKLATKEEISKLATKEEISKLATKEEVSKFFTKEDALNFATKDDLSKFATKEDMDDAIDSLAGAVKKGFDEVNERFGAVDGRFDALERKVDRIDSGLTAQIDHIPLNYASRQEFSRLDARIKKVERKVGMKIEGA